MPQHPAVQWPCSWPRHSQSSTGVCGVHRKRANMKERRSSLLLGGWKRVAHAQAQHHPLAVATHAHQAAGRLRLQRQASSSRLQHAPIGAAHHERATTTRIKNQSTKHTAPGPQSLLPTPYPPPVQAHPSRKKSCPRQPEAGSRSASPGRCSVCVPGGRGSRSGSTRAMRCPLHRAWQPQGCP